jgi:hypothetical protein
LPKMGEDSITLSLHAVPLLVKPPRPKGHESESQVRDNLTHSPGYATLDILCGTRRIVSISPGMEPSRALHRVCLHRTLPSSPLLLQSTLEALPGYTTRCKPGCNILAAIHEGIEPSGRAALCNTGYPTSHST